MCGRVGKGGGYCTWPSASLNVTSKLCVTLETAVFSASPWSTQLCASGAGVSTSRSKGEPASAKPKSEMAMLYLPETEGLQCTV